MSTPNINEAGYASRLTVVRKILTQHNLTPESITPVAYDPACPFPFNNYIYLVTFPPDSPVLPSSFSQNKPGTTPPAPSGISSLIVRLSNPQAEGLNRPAVRVQNEVAASFLARGVLPDLVPAVYSWGQHEPDDVGDDDDEDEAEHEHERTATSQGFGWTMAEYKRGVDLDSVFAGLSEDEDKRRRDVIDQVAEILEKLQSITLPLSDSDSAGRRGGLLGGLRFCDDHDEKGGQQAEHVVVGERSVLPAGPWEGYAEFWVDRLKAALEEADRSELLDGWKGGAEGGLRERIEEFLGPGDGVKRMLKLEGFDFGKRGLVHGDLTMNNMLFDAETNKITALLDFDWASISHPCEEFLSGLFDVGGGIHQRLEKIQDHIVSGDFSSLPKDLSVDTIEIWNVAKTWKQAVVKTGATSVDAVAGIKGVKALKTLESLLCPWQLTNTVMIRRLSKGDLQKLKHQTEESLSCWLFENGY